MNFPLYFRNRSRAASALVERHPLGSHEAQDIKWKALERWENEGGLIPGLPPFRASNRFPARDRRPRV